MMGMRVMTEPLFYTFRLEDHVPADRAWRAVDALLDTAFVRRVMAPHYSATGRPSIDPELMIRTLLIGYLSGIRSERRLCAEVHLNLAHRWFCRLGLDGAVPDHSTLAENRHSRFRDGGVFRAVFEEVVRRCAEAGLVPGEGAAVDGSQSRPTRAGTSACPATPCPRHGQPTARCRRDRCASTWTRWTRPPRPSRTSGAATRLIRTALVADSLVILPRQQA